MPADTTNLGTPEVKTVTSEVTVTGSTVTAVETKTSSSDAEALSPIRPNADKFTTMTVSSDEEALSFIVSEEAALMPTYPSWVKSVLATAIPTTWEEAMETNVAFINSEWNREKSGVLPDWYSSLPSDVKYIVTSDEAVYASELSTFKWPAFVISTPTATAGSSVTSLSSSTTMSTSGSGSAASQLKTATTSTSSGGARVTTGGFAMGIVGAAGIIGLTLVL